MTQLIRYEAARHALQVAHSVDEVKDIRDKAQAMAAYARQANDTQLVEWATEIKVRAERRAGEITRDIESQQGRRTSSQDRTKSKTEILATLGINRQTANRWEKLAAIPEDKFEQAVAAAREVAGEVTTAALLSIKSGERRAERVDNINRISAGNSALESVGKRFPVLYCDPPWRYEHIETESRAIENHYPTMGVDDICAMQIDAVALDDAVLFLWATSPKLEEAMRVIAAWGFSYRTCAVWDKEVIGMGYYFRQQHELLLVAVRGELPTPLPANRPSSVIRVRRQAHSAKPEEAYALIEGMYPEFEKVELFARNTRSGWACWGNQSQTV